MGTSGIQGSESQSLDVGGEGHGVEKEGRGMLTSSGGDPLSWSAALRIWLTFSASWKSKAGTP